MPTHQAPREHKSSLRGGNADEAIQNGMKRPAIYIMTNKRNGTLYTGVASNLVKRVYEHKNGAAPGFTKKYGCKRLVCYETHDSIDNAISREKQIKSGSRDKKIALIENMNPNWNDLYGDIP